MLTSNSRFSLNSSFNTIWDENSELNINLEEELIQPASNIDNFAINNGNELNLIEPSLIEDPILNEDLILEQNALLPCKQGEKQLCRIVRKKDARSSVVRYELYREGPNHTTRFCLASYKRSSRGASTYVIGTHKGIYKGLGRVVGKVKSNFVGTQFRILDNGANPNQLKRNSIQPNSNQQGSLKSMSDMSLSSNTTAGGNIDNDKVRRELGWVLYEPNILGFKGPRKMTLLMNPMVIGETDQVHHRPLTQKDSLLSKYEQNPLDPNLIVLKNKPPQWNEESQSYVLNFNGRVTLASVKNFQIVHEDDIDYVVMQFGRISESTFTMDFTFPLNLVQAFGIAITSFDNKLACE